MSSKASLLFLLAAVLTRPCTADTHQKIESATSCVARAVMGQPASITCDFGRDVTATKHSIDVQFYPGDSNEPLSVLTCNWLVKRPDKPTCTASKECSYDGHLGRTLLIELTNATKANEGRYICQLVPSDGIPAQPCRLNVTDEPAVPANHLTDSNSTVTPNTETPVESGRQVNTPAIALGVLTVLLVFCNLMLVLIVWRLWRKRQLRGDHRRQENSESSSSSSSSEPWLKTNEPSDSCTI